MNHNCRAQAYTFETILAILFLGVFVTTILPTVAIPEFTENRDAVERESEIEREAQGVIDASLEDGSLKSLLLSWDDDEEEFTADGTATGTEGQFLQYPNNPFGDRLDRFADRNNVSVNVVITPQYQPSEADESELSEPPASKFIEVGVPSDHTVVVSETVILQEDHRLESPPQTHARNSPPIDPRTGDGEALGDASTYPVVEAGGEQVDSSVYQAVEVKLIIWYDRDST